MEIHQSILLHKALSGGTCHHLSELAEGVPDFQDAAARPQSPSA
ncbi:hypothetical protein [Corynebacterium halotolerans]|nr:hypothetical protein [Corynebacterium halotolerans]